MFTFIQKWHKKIGTYIALFVVFLAISGIALNHSEKLKLNTTYIKVDWLLNLYQVNPKSEPIGYLSSNNWVTGPPPGPAHRAIACLEGRVAGAADSGSHLGSGFQTSLPRSWPGQRRC